MTTRLIVARIRALQAAGLTVTGMTADGTILTTPIGPTTVQESDREDELCRKLFLREAS